jgi:hypothetical protein
MAVSQLSFALLALLVLLFALTAFLSDAPRSPAPAIADDGEDPNQWGFVVYRTTYGDDERWEEMKPGSRTLLKAPETQLKAKGSTRMQQCSSISRMKPRFGTQRRSKSDCASLVYKDC